LEGADLVMSNLKVIAAEKVFKKENSTTYYVSPIEEEIIDGTGLCILFKKKDEYAEYDGDTNYKIGFPGRPQPNNTYVTSSTYSDQYDIRKCMYTIANSSIDDDAARELFINRNFYKMTVDSNYVVTNITNMTASLVEEPAKVRTLTAVNEK
jgi:hypothetical protein